MLSGALTGDWTKLETSFSVARSGDDQHWQVALRPRKADDPGMPFQAIDVTGSQFVDELQLKKPDGDFDRLDFYDQAISDQPLTEAEAAAFATTAP
jgi:hypothetical protein